jgi:hypothetical protein
VEFDGGAWSSMCGNGTGISPTSAASHESHPSRLLAGVSVVEARWRRSRLASSVEAVVARRQHGGSGRGRLGPVGNVARRRQHKGGCRGYGVALWRTGGGEAEWGGRMSTTTQEGNGAASVGRGDGTSGSGVCGSERKEASVCLVVLGHVRLSYNPYFSACFSAKTIFFSHNKSANSTFSHGFSGRSERALSFIISEQGNRLMPTAVLSRVCQHRQLQPRRPGPRSCVWVQAEAQCNSKTRPKM